MGRLSMVEDSLHTQRELNQQLQKRLSIRHQENRLLRKEIFREQQSARIAHEVADAVERQLADLGTAYDALRESHMVQAKRIRELEGRTLLGCIRDRFDAWIAKSLTTEVEYYGILVDPAFRRD